MAIEGVGGSVANLIRPMFRPLSIAASGLSAQRQRIEVIAMNIANAETTRGVDGEAYRRKTVVMAPAGQAGEAAGGAGAVEAAGGGVEVAGIEEDLTPGPLVYDPGHPDADEAGYVRYPNVQLEQEMVDLIDARRFYEANATVFQAIKSMLRRATEI